MLPGYLSEGENRAVLLRVKAVPGAKREGIVGPLGERLKVRVSAPPEGGRANEAICRVIASAIGVRDRDVEIVSGASNPEKTLCIRGVDAATVAARLAPFAS